MSTKDSPTVALSVQGVLEDYTKSTVDRDLIIRSTDTGLNSLRHAKLVTKAGRHRNMVSLQAIDESGDEPVKAVVTLSVDFEQGEAAQAIDAAMALVGFLLANSGEEVTLLVAGHNYG